MVQTTGHKDCFNTCWANDRKTGKREVKKKINLWTLMKDHELWKELPVSHQTTDRLTSMWLIYFRPNIVRITPLKERGIGLSSKLFQFPFQTAFCTDLNSQSFISVKRPWGSLFLCEPSEIFKISFFLPLYRLIKKNIYFYHTV